MQQTIAQRLKVLAEYEVKQVKLAMKINLSPQAISKTISEDRMLRSDTLENIARAYPELNMRWFLTGEGESGLPGPGRFPLPAELQVDKTAELDLKTKVISLLEGEIRYLKLAIKDDCEQLAKRLGL